MMDVWRQRLFATPLMALTTIVIASLLAWALIPFLNWALFSATFSGETRADCAAGGACWVFVKARFGQFMMGMYPAGERWRVYLLGLLLVLAVVVFVRLKGPSKTRFGLSMLVLLPPVGLWLLAGGFGLPPVETREWGGLMLTVFMSVYAALIALPLGILFALGRQSQLPVIRLISVIFIEVWRGVPIIAVIFLASLLLPLIMPAGVTIDKLARAVIGLGLVIAAYLAEAIRGGLQALPSGQSEAASALGLGYWRQTALIVLPQALRISLPAMTNEFISLIKNTTLVLVVSILDLLGVAQAAIADPAWVGMNLESYLFAGALYWLICYGLSLYGQRLERSQRRGH